MGGRNRWPARGFLLPVKLRTINLDDERSLTFLEGGAGPPILLIHGALATRDDWSPELLAWLAGRGRVIALDRPGHGESRRRRFAGSPRAQARQIREALGSELDAPALLVGHSFGAYVALAFAESFPSEVAGILLLAPIGLPELRPFEHFVLAPRSMPIIGPVMSAASRPLFAAPFLALIHRLMFAPQPVPPDWQARYPFPLVANAGHLVREGEDAASILPWSPEAYLNLRSVQVPVRILAGEADRIVDPPRQAVPLTRLLPAAELTLVPAVGHMIHHGAADAVREAIEELLRLHSASVSRKPPRSSLSSPRRRRKA